MGSSGTFDELIAEGASVPTGGWDFSWFDGRATEERPSWGYAKLLADRMTGATAVLDVQTGGGEVFAGALAQAKRTPSRIAATEAWPPNLEIARRTLGRFGGVVTRPLRTASCRSVPNHSTSWSTDTQS